MFFTEEEMKQAETLAWQNLDAWNHDYMPGLDDYPHFYFKNRAILDPWMNEKSQGCCWPNHEDKNIAVDPVEYYGEGTIENYVAQMFMRYSSKNSETIARIKDNSDEKGRLYKTTQSMPIEVYVAMSEKQAEEEKGYTCIGEPLPDSPRIYHEMMELPEGFAKIGECGWKREVLFPKKYAAAVFAILYHRDVNPSCYRKLLDRVHGREVRLIGFGN